MKLSLGIPKLKYVGLGLVVLLVGFSAFNLVSSKLNGDKEVYFNGASHPFKGKIAKIEINGTTLPIPVEGIIFNEEGVPIYKGTFTDGKMTGTGQLLDTEANIIYEGAVKDGLREGVGIEYAVDGKDRFKTYEGEFKNDVYNGNGTKIDFNGIIEYEGGFKDGRFSGKGKYYNTDGTLRFDSVFTDGSTSGENKTMSDSIRFVQDTEHFRIYTELTYDEYKKYLKFMEGVYTSLSKVINMDGKTPINVYFVQSQKFMAEQRTQLAIPETDENSKVLIVPIGREIFLKGSSRDYFPEYLLALAMGNSNLSSFSKSVIKEYYRDSVGFLNADGVQVHLTYGYGSSRKIKTAFEEIQSYKLVDILAGEYTVNIAHAFGQFLKETGHFDEYVAEVQKGQFTETEILERMYAMDIQGIDGAFVQFIQAKRAVFYPVVRPIIFDTQAEFETYRTQLNTLLESSKK